MQLRNRRGLVGGAWQADDPIGSKCFLDLESEGLSIDGVTKASSMLEFLTWDPTAVAKTPISVCSIPVAESVGGVQSAERSCWTMLRLVGGVMAKSEGLIRGIVFDAHGSHSLVRKVIHGEHEEIGLEDLKDIEWFRDLEWVDLPKCNLPRLPIKKCLHLGEVVYALPGPCSLTLIYSNLALVISFCSLFWGTAIL